MARTDPTSPTETAAQERSVIIVNERALVGPNSAAQLRGGRLFLPDRDYCPGTRRHAQLRFDTAHRDGSSSKWHDRGFQCAAE